MYIIYSTYFLLSIIKQFFVLLITSASSIKKRDCLLRHIVCIFCGEKKDYSCKLYSMSCANTLCPIYLFQYCNQSGPGLWCPPCSLQPSLENGFCYSILVVSVVGFNRSSDSTSGIIEQTNAQVVISCSNSLNGFK